MAQKKIPIHCAAHSCVFNENAYCNAGNIRVERESSGEARCVTYGCRMKSEGADTEFSGELDYEKAAPYGAVGGETMNPIGYVGRIRDSGPPRVSCSVRSCRYHDGDSECEADTLRVSDPDSTRAQEAICESYVPCGQCR